MEKFDIITIGSATKDVFLRSEEFKVIKDSSFITGQAECFALGSKIEIKNIVFATGGGGANTARTFARQGLKTACIGVVGSDSDGKELLEKLNKEGVNTDFFQIHDDDRTAYSIILVTPGAERTILSYKGEGQHFDFEKIPLEKLDTEWLYLDSLGGHYDILEGLMNFAFEKGIKVATNPGGKELAHGLEKWRPFLEKVDIYISNQEEAARLSGIEFKKEEEIIKFFAEIIKGIFIMNQGPKGVVVHHKGTLYRAGIPDSPVIERTGAGDSFGSGFVSGYIQSNGDIKHAIQLATANASSVVTKFGATQGILKKGDKGPWPLVNVETSELTVNS